MMLSESQIEDVFETFYGQLISNDLTFIGRQCTVADRRIDLLFHDKQSRNVEVELKRDAPTREDIGQLLEYAGLIENSRVVLAAPVISSRIKQAFNQDTIILETERALPYVACNPRLVSWRFLPRRKEANRKMKGSFLVTVQRVSGNRDGGVVPAL